MMPSSLKKDSVDVFMFIRIYSVRITTFNVDMEIEKKILEVYVQYLKNNQLFKTKQHPAVPALGWTGVSAYYNRNSKN